MRTRHRDARGRPGHGGPAGGATVSDSGAVLLIKASQDCYGSYATTSELLANGQFSVPGTFTQLTGLYPGQVDYAAIITGTINGNEASVAVAVSALKQTFGPYILARGAGGGWSGCAYP